MLCKEDRTFHQTDDSVPTQALAHFIGAYFVSYWQPHSKREERSYLLRSSLRSSECLGMKGAYRKLGDFKPSSCFIYSVGKNHTYRR